MDSLRFLHGLNLYVQNLKFIEALQTAYSIYKTDKVWRKAYGKQALLSKQANIISESVMTCPQPGGR